MIKVKRYSSIELVPIILFFMILASYVSYGYYLFPYNISVYSSDSIIPSLWLLGDLELVPDTIFSQIVSSMVSATVRLQVAISNSTGLDRIVVERWWTLSSVIIGLFAVFFTGYILNRSLVVAALCVAILPVSWVKGCMIGHGINFWDAPPNASAWGLAVCILIWAIWLMSGKTFLDRVVPYLLCGLLFNFQPPWSVSLVIIIFLGDSYKLTTKDKTEHSMPDRISPIIIGVVLYFLASLPYLLPLLNNFFLSAPKILQIDSWWRIMQWRKLYHLVPWRSWEMLSKVILAAILYCQLLFLMSTSIPIRIFKKLAITFTAVAIVVLFVIIATEVFGNTSIASLTLTRITVFLPLGVVVISCQMFWSQISKVESISSNKLHSAASLILPMMLIIIGGRIWLYSGLAAALLLSAVLLSRKISSLRQLEQWIFIGVVIILGHILFLSLSYESDWHSLIDSGINFFAFAYSIIVYLWIWQPNFVSSRTRGISVTLLLVGAFTNYFATNLIVGGVTKVTVKCLSIWLLLGGMISLVATLLKDSWLRYFSIGLIVSGVAANEFVLSYFFPEAFPTRHPQHKIANLNIRGLQVLTIMSGFALLVANHKLMRDRGVSWYRKFQSKLKTDSTAIWYFLILTGITLIFMNPKLDLIGRSYKLITGVNPYQNMMKIPGVQNWVGLTKWMRTNTPKDALFLMPPYPGFSSGMSHRSSIMDAMDFGSSIYYPNVLELELKAMRVIYNIDFTREVQLGSFHCEMEIRYKNFLGDKKNFVRAKTEFPTLSFVVGMKNGARPPRWNCGAFAGEILDLPIVFQNDMYVVYDVRYLDGV